MVPIYALNNERKTKNSSMQELFRIRTIKVLRGNFSAVDLREEPCHNGLSEKEKHGGKWKQRNGGRRRNRAILQAGQRKTPCPPPRVLSLSFWRLSSLRFVVLGKLKA